MKGQTSPIRVLLVDDHPVVREGLAVMLADQPDIEVVDTASDGSTAEALALAMRPDVVLMDFRLPGEDGLVVAQRIREALPQTRVLMLTGHDERELIVRASQVGAAGIVSKDASASLVVEAIHTVSKGKPYVPANLAGFLFDQLRDPVQGAHRHVSERQREILQLVAQGLSNLQIAEHFFVSEVTVRREIHRTIRLLGARDRTEAVAKAIRKGLI